LDLVNGARITEDLATGVRMVMEGRETGKGVMENHTRTSNLAAARKKPPMMVEEALPFLKQVKGNTGGGRTVQEPGRGRPR
jgi:hypothetical protein